MNKESLNVENDVMCVVFCICSMVFICWDHPCQRGIL